MTFSISLSDSPPNPTLNSASQANLQEEITSSISKVSNQVFGIDNSAFERASELTDACLRGDIRKFNVLLSESDGVPFPVYQIASMFNQSEMVVMIEKKWDNFFNSCSEARVASEKSGKELQDSFEQTFSVKISFEGDEEDKLLRALNEENLIQTICLENPPNSDLDPTFIEIKEDPDQNHYFKDEQTDSLAKKRKQSRHITDVGMDKKLRLMQISPSSVAVEEEKLEAQELGLTEEELLAARRLQETYDRQSEPSGITMQDIQYAVKAKIDFDNSRRVQEAMLYRVNIFLNCYLKTPKTFPESKTPEKLPTLFTRSELDKWFNRIILDSDKQWGIFHGLASIDDERVIEQVSTALERVLDLGFYPSMEDKAGLLPVEIALNNVTACSWGIPELFLFGSKLEGEGEDGADLQYSISGGQLGWFTSFAIEVLTRYRDEGKEIDDGISLLKNIIMKFKEYLNDDWINKVYNYLLDLIPRLKPRQNK